MASPFAPLVRLFRRAPDRARLTRGFDAAAGGWRGASIGTMGGPLGPTASVTGPLARARARHAAVNNPWIAHAVANWVAALAGTGINPTPSHPDATVRADLGALWTRWGEEADADGRTDVWGLQADLARALVVDGEAFLQVIETSEGPRLRQLPPELIDETLTRELAGGYIVSGVEFNADGQRVAYHVLPTKPTDHFAAYAAPVRVPADQILHVMKPLGVGQVRGVSWLAPVILPASELDQLIDALLVGAKVAAMHAAFLVDLNGTASGEPYTGEEVGGILETGLEPGTMKRLPSGLDVKFNTPGQTNEVGAFLRLNLRQLAAGLGLPSHMVDGDLSDANYSSLRAGLLPFRQRVEQVQYGCIVPQALNPIWRRVVQWAVLTGELDAPDFEG
jgi:lambda family phage portal protein